MKTAGEIIDPATGEMVRTAIGPVERIKWLEQVAGDTRLGDADKSFAIAVQHFVHRRAGFAFCGEKGLAERAGVANRTARMRLASLSEAGHVFIQRRGPHPAALFLVLKDRQESCLSDSQKTGNILVNDRQESGQKTGKPHFSNDVKSDSCEPITQRVTQRVSQRSAVASARASSARAAPSQVRERTDSGYAPPADHPSIAGNESRDTPQSGETEAPKPKRRRIDYKAILAQLDLESSIH